MSDDNLEAEEEDGLEYEMDMPSGDSYTTPLSTGGCSEPSLALSHSPTLGDSNLENNVALRTEELEAHIEAFLEEVEEDLEVRRCLLLRTLHLCRSLLHSLALFPLP